MATMLETDIEESAEREGYTLVNEDSAEIHNNNVILNKAHNLAIREFSMIANHFQNLGNYIMK